MMGGVKKENTIKQHKKITTLEAVPDIPDSGEDTHVWRDVPEAIFTTIIP